MKIRKRAFFSRACPAIIRNIFLAGAVKNIAGNTAWLMLDKIVRMLLGLTVGAWVARYLGPSLYGELAYSIALVALFQTIANLGADGIIVRSIVRDMNDVSQILGSAIWLRIVFGIFSWLLVIALVFILQPGNYNALIIVSIVGGILVFQATDTIDLWFQSQNQNKRTVIPKLLAYVFTNGIKIILILNSAPLLFFAAALLVDVIISSIGLWYSYKKFPSENRWIFKYPVAKSILKESFPYLVSGLATMLYMRIDQVMIREYVGVEELGLYSAALTLSTFWAFIPMTLYIALGPYIAEKKLESEAAYYKSLELTFSIFGALGISVVAVTILIGPNAIDLLFGEAYASAKNMLLLHIFTNLFIFLGIGQGLWIINDELGRINIYKTFIGLLVCLIGNILLVPRYGAIGSAIVAVFVQFSSAVASNLIFSKRIFYMQMKALFPFHIIFKKRKLN